MIFRRLQCTVNYMTQIRDDPPIVRQAIQCTFFIDSFQFPQLIAVAFVALSGRIEKCLCSSKMTSPTPNYFLYFIFRKRRKL